MDQLATPASSDPLLTGLLARITSYRPDADLQLITRGYQAAAYWHQGQQRKSGDAYLTHPVAVAAILAGLGADDQTLCAALLHDTAEDTAYTLAAMRQEFGAEITGLVAATSALDKMPAEQVSAACTDSAAAIALAGDRRALVIKLADRLHNTRTIQHLPRAKQLDKSRQTLDVMVPLARTLGMDSIGAELKSRAAATLKQRPGGSASSHVLTAAAVVLPRAARARWRAEWLAELHYLPTRRERATFAVQIVLGVGRLATTLYQPAAAVRQAFGVVLTTAAAASGLVAGGWRAAVALAATVLAVLAGLLWVLGSDHRTRRLAELIRAARGLK
jgi:HD domain